MKVVDEALLDEFRGVGRCEWCGHVSVRDPHHIWARGMGGGGRLDVRINLIALCRLCHARCHVGHILREDLLAIVAQREHVLQAEIVAEIHHLRRTPR